MSKPALVKTRTSQEFYDRLERIRLHPKVRREKSDFYRMILEEYADRVEREMGTQLGEPVASAKNTPPKNAITFRTLPAKGRTHKMGLPDKPT